MWMKDKKTILLIAVLLALVGVYVWHSQRVKPKVKPPTQAPATVRLDPNKQLAQKVRKAIRTYKKDKGSVPQNLDQLKGKYLDEATLKKAKDSKLQYVHVNPQAFRLNLPVRGTKPIVVASKKKPKPGASSATPAASATASKKPVTQETGWKYDPRNKPDPFKPFIIARRTPTVTPKKRTGPVTPLQKMPLSEIQAGLKAIIWGQMGARALVEDATGKGYVVREGTYVGQNDGIVKKIHEDRIVVEEYRRDPIEDRLVAKQVVLKLKKGEGEE
jgi:type IV pilus assembly protein PilP